MSICFSCLQTKDRMYTVERSFSRIRELLATEHGTFMLPVGCTVNSPERRRDPVGQHRLSWLPALNPASAPRLLGTCRPADGPLCVFLFLIFERRLLTAPPNDRCDAE